MSLTVTNRVPAPRESSKGVDPTHGALSPLGMGAVTITGGFWADKQRVNATASIRHSEDWIERSGWVANFDAAVAGTLPDARSGPVFADSDVYKLMEAMAWEIGRSADEALDARFEALVARILPAQESDGYLNTAFGRPGQPGRYSDLEWGHELYCFGHLIQAAVARARTHGVDSFVELAVRAADHVVATFGVGGIERVCGHPEIEVALVELFRLTGDPSYLRQATLFIDRRGTGTLGAIDFGAEYFQDRLPVRQTPVMEGHSVRALYLAAGAVDVAVETGDDELLNHIRSQAAATIARRTYITGGMGSHHEGESFGVDYELPPDRAYSETCAGIASVMVHYRLMLATGDLSYGDIIERTLYNVVAVSAAEDGRSFYYSNTLHQREEGAAAASDQASHRAGTSLRAPWFDVSCCPTNVARTLSSLDSYVATSTAEGVQLSQYASSSIRAAIEGGQVQLRVTTDYPHDGRIAIEVVETPEVAWTLSLRVPAWAKDAATVTVNGEASPAAPGALDLHRVFEAGDSIVLDLPMVARWTAPDPRVDAVRGQVAVELGPLVLALESVDLPDGISVNDIAVVPGTTPEVVDGRATVELAVTPFGSDAWPYRSAESVGTDGATPTRSRASSRVALTPYHSWANRGPSTMRVWMPVDNG